MNQACAAISTAHDLRRPLSFLVLFILLLVALIASADRLQLSDSYFDEMLTDEMYRNEVEWRPPPEYDSEWRSGAQRQKDQGRIRFGYDSAYDELMSRDFERNSGTSFENDRIRPNTILRIQFY